MMRRIALLVVVLLLLAACGDSDDVASATSTTATTSTTAESTDPTVAPNGDAASEPPDDGSPTDEPTTTEVPEEPETTEDAPVADEIGLLCSAYLDSINPTTFDQGLAALTSVLGNDAPAGVLGAIDTLQNPDNDVEAFFTARNSIDSYVLPVCEQQFRSNITALADDAAAADAFIIAVRDGDRASAELLAPTNVIVQFDWSGYPQMTADINSDNSTLDLVLEPTVTVFCQLSGGTVEFCAFGE